MKKIISIVFSILISLIICSSTFAQVPKAFNYQAVVRDADGYVISNQSVGFRISILQGGLSVFSELHNVQTNQFGLVSMQIGNGTMVSGNFNNILWGMGACYLKVEMDPTGGTSYSVSGTEELLSVPYALYAESSGVGGSGGDGNNQDELQDLQLIGNFLSITKNTNAKQLDLGKFMDNTDNQELQFNGNSLSITGGNSLTLPGESDPVFNASVAKTITDAGSFNVITNAERTELNNNSTLLNVTPGTISPGKAVVVDNNKDISSFRNLNASGVVQFGNTIIIDGTGLEGSITETHGKISFGDENIYTTGFIGAGTNAPATNLHVVGGLRYVDGNQAANRILTTDINGNATWQDPAAQLPAHTGNGGKYLTTDGTDASWKGITNTDITGLGTMSTQNKDAVDIDGGTIDGTTIGVNAAALGKFSSLEATQNLTLPATTTTTGLFYSGTNIIMHNYGTNNLFFGIRAGNLTTTTVQNVGIGTNALNKVTSGGFNTALGFNTMSANTTGHSNTALGNGSLGTNIDGSFNVAIGLFALVSNTSGSRNTVIGYDALRDNTSGEYNVGVGSFTNQGNKTGSYNTSLGYEAGGKSDGLNKSGNIFLGYKAGYEETGSNKLYVENSNSTTPLIYGDFSADKLRVNGTLEISSTVKIEGGTPGAGKFLESDANGIANWANIANTDVSGLGTMSTQNKGTVDIDGGAIDGTAIGANSASSAKFSSLNINSKYNLPTVDGSSGQVLSTNGSGTTSWTNNTESVTYSIGSNSSLGGYVFYVTPDGKHGLVAATQDQTANSTWFNAKNQISNPANHNTAGKKFTDWRLPTKYEIDLMFTQKANIGGFDTSRFYWSSTETSSTNAYNVYFNNGSQYNAPKTNTVYTRAVRSF